MDRALAQSTYLSSLVSVPRHGQIKGYEKTSPRTVRMICNLQVSPLRMVCFPGKGGSNALGTMVRPGLDFHSKAGPMISYRRRKSTRFVPKARFERFTEKAIKVILLAQEETKLLGHNFLGTEQILLGLIGEGTGIAANVLESMGINLKEARIEVEKIIGRGSGFVSREIQFTLHAKRVLEISLEEARQLGHSYIGSEHLLLGLLREGEGVAAKVLEILGADPSTIRTQVLESVGAGFDFPYEAGPMISYRQRKSTRFVPKARFERFTEKAIKVMMLAREETKRLGHNFAGTEQILLGLIGEGTGIAANVLKSMGINLKEARIEVEKIIGRGSGFVSREIPFTPPAKRVLELSLEEARQLGHSYVGSEHLLLGLLRVREGVAAKILENLGADPNSIRTQVFRMIGKSSEPPFGTLGT